jgi:hypothetical protein
LSFGFLPFASPGLVTLGLVLPPPPLEWCLNGNDVFALAAACKLTSKALFFDECGEKSVDAVAAAFADLRVEETGVDEGLIDTFFAG